MAQLVKKIETGSDFDICIFLQNDNKFAVTTHDSITKKHNDVKLYKYFDQALEDANFRKKQFQFNESKNNVISLTEKQLKNVIKESVNRILKESKPMKELILRNVKTEYVKTSSVGNPMFYLEGITENDETFNGYTKPNASCGYLCRGLNTEFERRRNRLVKIQFYQTPKGINYITDIELIDNY